MSQPGPPRAGPRGADGSHRTQIHVMYDVCAPSRASPCPRSASGSRAAARSGRRRGGAGPWARARGRRRRRRLPLREGRRRRGAACCSACARAGWRRGRELLMEGRRRRKQDGQARGTHCTARVRGRAPLADLHSVGHHPLHPLHHGGHHRVFGLRGENEIRPAAGGRRRLGHHVDPAGGGQSGVSGGAGGGPAAGRAEGAPSARAPCSEGLALCHLLLWRRLGLSKWGAGPHEWARQESAVGRSWTDPRE